MLWWVFGFVPSIVPLKVTTSHSKMFEHRTVRNGRSKFWFLGFGAALLKGDKT